ncbi:hypothetical protein [Chachezhania antarctica]|mgnify:FL=1|uniref:hypothetical protein n=1 Tax=Chachezhania antarctica TaxID=2340860 RepID=UPI000EAFAA6F|nr:hypothetical protein [Chachezhania antarctica]
MPHDIVNGHIGHHHHHPHDHNHDHGPDHLHSHMEPADHAADLQVLAAQFIDGFQQAKDKQAYLKLAGVPLEITPGDGPALKLVDVQLTTEWQVGTASPSFGSTELSYLPFPGNMITERTNMGFVYVSMRDKKVVDLRDFLSESLHD